MGRTPIRYRARTAGAADPATRTLSASGSPGGDPSARGIIRAMPPIDELTRIEPVHLARLDHQGIFTTGLLLEVSETPTRRQTLADQVGATTNDVLMWRDEALMLNLASFGPDEHHMLIQAQIEGLRDILELRSTTSTRASGRARRARRGPADRPHDRGLVGPGKDARGRVGPRLTGVAAPSG